MKLIAFIKDKCLLLLLHAVCMALLSGFLHLTGYGRDFIWLILLVWGLILSEFLAVSYLERRRYFQEIEDIMENIDRHYLLGELLPRSFRLEDCIYQEMIRRSNKSVIKRIRQIEEQQKEYQEYIESWVHEVKAPITGIASICENYRKRGAGRDRGGGLSQKLFLVNFMGYLFGLKYVIIQIRIVRDRNGEDWKMDLIEAIRERHSEIGMGVVQYQYT